MCTLFPMEYQGPRLLATELQRVQELQERAFVVWREPLKGSPGRFGLFSMRLDRLRGSGGGAIVQVRRAGSQAP